MPDKPGNRVAIRLKAVGVLDGRGKFRKEMGFSGGIAADPDKPLSTLAAGLIELITFFARYSDAAAAERDRDGLKAFLDTLTPEVRQGKDAPGA